MPPWEKIKIPVITRHLPAKRAVLELTVSEPAGIARQGYPVRWGVPFHRGVLPDPRNVRLLDETGREMPLQTKVTCYWPEGEVKWLVLEFSADIAANRTASYRLEYGTEIAPSKTSGAIIVSDNNSLTVRFPEISAEFRKSAGTLIDRVAWTEKGSGACHTNIKGFLDYSRSPIKKPEALSDQEQAELPWEQTSPMSETLTTQPLINTFEVVETGAVQVTVRVTGTYASDALCMPFRAYVRIYATGFVQITHTLIYDGYACRDHIRSYGLKCNTGFEDADATLGLAGGLTASGPARLGPYIAQTAHNQARLFDGTQNSAVSRTEGWIALNAGGTGLAVALQHAWQNYPVRLAVAEEHTSASIALNLYGATPEDFLDLRYPQEEQKSHSFQGSSVLTDNYCGHGWEQARGIGKTHVVVIKAHTATAPANTRLGPCLDQPLLATVDPAYIADTCALGHIAAYKQDPRFANCERYFDLLLDYHLFMRDNAAIYGFVDYGDIYGMLFPLQGKVELDPRCWASVPGEGPFDKTTESGGLIVDNLVVSKSGELIGNTLTLPRPEPIHPGSDFVPVMDGAHGWASGEKGPNGFFMHFLMGGKRRFWDFFEHQIRHAMDIDTEHLGHERPLGFGMRHNQIHWRSGAEPRQYPAVGCFYHYWLTGDPRTFDRIEEFIEWVRPAWLNDTVIMLGQCAGPGHYPLLLAWQTTGRKDLVHHIQLQARYHEEAFLCGYNLPGNKYFFPVDESHRWEGQWMEKVRQAVPDLLRHNPHRDTTYLREYLDFCQRDALEPLSSASGDLPRGTAPYWHNYYYKDYFIEYVELTGDPDVARMLLTIGFVSLASGELGQKSSWGTTERMLDFLYQATGQEEFRKMLYHSRIEMHAGPHFTGEAREDGQYEVSDFLGRRGGFVATYGHNVTICLTPHPREMAYAFHAFAAPGTNRMGD